MRIVMMGTGPFAVPTFQALLASGHAVVGLVTRPTPPVKGRGPAPVNPMRQAAEAGGVAVFDPPSVNSTEAHSQLAAWQADLFVVCDYGQILSSATLGLARCGGINLHGSLLPRYRGAAPVHWAIFHGDQETGVSVIHMTPQLDGGPILQLVRTPIGPDETTGELEPRLAELGVAAVVAAIGQLEHWDGVTRLGERQDASLASRAPRLTKAHGLVDWKRSARQIRDQVRAFQPWPGTYTHWHTPKGESLRLILDRVVEIVPGSIAGAGQVVRASAGQLWVATGDGWLGIQRLQPAGKRVLEVDEFLRGYPVQVGQSLQTL